MKSVVEENLETVLLFLIISERSVLLSQSTEKASGNKIANSPY